MVTLHLLQLKRLLHHFNVSDPFLTVFNQVFGALFDCSVKSDGVAQLAVILVALAAVSKARNSESAVWRGNINLRHAWVAVMGEAAVKNAAVINFVVPVAVNNPNFIAAAPKVCDGDFFVHVFNVVRFSRLSS